MAKNLSDWYDHVLPHVPGCGAPLALLFIREALREFQRLTKIQRLDFTATGIAVVAAGPADFQDVTITGLPTNTVVHELERAWWNDDDNPGLGLIGPQTDLFYGPDSVLAVDDLPRYASIGDQNTLRLMPAPTADGVVRGRAVLIASPSATTCIDRIFDQHYEIVAGGAVAKLLQSPKKPWTDVELGLAKWSEFIGNCSSLSIMLGQGMTYAPNRVRPVDRIEE